MTLSDDGWNNVIQAATIATNELAGPEPAAYRANLFGREPSGLRWITEAAVGDDPSAPPPRPNRPQPSSHAFDSVAKERRNEKLLFRLCSGRRGKMAQDRER